MMQADGPLGYGGTPPWSCYQAALTQLAASAGRSVPVMAVDGPVYAYLGGDTGFVSQTQGGGRTLRNADQPACYSEWRFTWPEAVVQYEGRRG